LHDGKFDATLRLGTRPCDSGNARRKTHGDTCERVANAARPRIHESQETTMNLILWRHAEAEDVAQSDLARQLTPRGRKQAQSVAKWLRARLDDDAVILASPAARTVQTVEALTEQYRVVRELAPGASATDVLTAVGWPDGIASTVVVVGHQPTLGQVAALLLSGNAASWPLKKSGLWWLANRERAGDEQVVLRAAISPDLV
jgi:phosphohistidine phosphatase